MSERSSDDRSKAWRRANPERARELTSRATARYRERKKAMVEAIDDALAAETEEASE